MKEYDVAEEAYKNGYDKGYSAGYTASNWISVEDRLPQEDVRVLVAIKSDRSYTEIDTDRIINGKWVRWFKDVTHWMALPEPPKMKGN